MLIRYTAALFDNAVFSKPVWASGVCLYLIRLGQGSIVDVEDLVAKQKYNDEGLQCLNACSSCTWWFYWRGIRYPTSADSQITFFLKQKISLQDWNWLSVRCYYVAWWLLLSGIDTDINWSYLIKLEKVCSSEIKLSYRRGDFLPLFCSHTIIYCMFIHPQLTSTQSFIV